MVKVPKGYRSKNIRDVRDGGSSSSGGGRGFGFPSRGSSGGGLGGGGLGGGLGGALGGAGAGAAAAGGKRRGCGGIGLILVLVVFALLFFSCVNSGGSSNTSDTSTGGSSTADSATANTSPATGGELGEAEDLVNFVLDDVQAFWTNEFAEAGLSPYPELTLVLFDDDVNTGGCGRATSAVGPFYCPADSRAYIDLVYMIRLQRQLGAEGDFSQAYIVAHEIGHHVQNVLGTNDAVRRAQSGASQTQSNALQVMMELQADCFAGAWSRDADERGILDANDLQEGVRAAGAVGDDAITGSNNQENFTHGSSAQRIEWFQRGYDSGSDFCDTFNGDLG